MSTGSAPPTTGDETGNHGETVSDLLNAAPSTTAHLPCRRDPDLWFAEKPSDLERAKRLCGDCPIRSECLTGALSRGEPWGVWGGEIVEQGTVIHRKKPRGRPRKHPVEDTEPGRNSTNGRRAA
ncbi:MULTISPECIES: WhiB family transcriptional regulator [unclassified Actinopolyspora]|uniref:WhiB family transcriptional regulator n=1 Tax=unclassified Actinopolyspora TaxID=2639451 RepID=UPI0013F5DB2B|nr:MULTISPECIES: WhiB family transcriptional regulator [unclassified Actinopolyspora]NHD17991.1 WhiB family transcriptional regulator [Actinopolyspora sp. BKK2]NHE77864.1 WhiB family transcriptional regulator [Actinopolyspora sp. BKK1]